jgi:hypothetical protein
MTSKISSAGAAMSITATGAQVERRHASQAAKPDGRATVSTDGSSSGWPDRGGTRFAMSARNAETASSGSSTQASWCVATW